MTNKNLLLQDFGLSTFAQDIFKSTLNQDDERQLQKLIIQQRKDKLDHESTANNNDDDDDDDDIPLSKCLFDSTTNGSRWTSSQSAPSSRRPSQKILQPQQPYSILEDETLHEDDDEDLLPIGVLQDPKAKLLHPCQSAAEKYKNSILGRQKKHDQGDRSRRSSFDPSSSRKNNDDIGFTSVMRSVSAHHRPKKPLIHHNVTSVSTILPGQHYSSDDDDDDDDDDDVPLFKTCLAMPSSNGEKVGL